AHLGTVTRTGAPGSGAALKLVVNTAVIGGVGPGSTTPQPPVSPAGRPGWSLTCVRQRTCARLHGGTG
ncbi:hypothetical protein ABZT43_51420, partial [Streptomyces sp. NPDC005349]